MNIAKKIHRGQQCLVYEEIFSYVDGITLKVEIKSDAQPVGSYARCEVFSKAEMKWNLVSQIHHGSMKTAPNLRNVLYELGEKDEHFKEDRDALVFQANKILQSGL
jgi:hypothetical protein